MLDYTRLTEGLLGIRNVYSVEYKKLSFLAENAGVEISVNFDGRDGKRSRIDHIVTFSPYDKLALDLDRNGKYLIEMLQYKIQHTIDGTGPAYGQ